MNRSFVHKCSIHATVGILNYIFIKWISFYKNKQLIVGFNWYLISIVCFLVITNKLLQLIILLQSQYFKIWHKNVNTKLLNLFVLVFLLYELHQSLIFEAQFWSSFVIKEDKMNVPQVASSIKFLADSSSKQGIHYLDYCIVLSSIKGIESLCLCWLFFLSKNHLQCAFLDFQ